MCNISTSLSLSDLNYFQTSHKKTAIVLHHTVGGSAISTFRYWESSPTRIATAYIIGRDGTIYEIFDPIHWAYHLGLKGTNGRIDKSTIGIELASIGPLLWSNDKYYMFGRVTPETVFQGDELDIFDVASRLPGGPDTKYVWRGYRFFAKYPAEQLKSLRQLLTMLSKQFNIPLTYPDTSSRAVDGLNISIHYPITSKGVYTHAHVRLDKTDLHPGFDWDTMMINGGISEPSP